MADVLTIFSNNSDLAFTPEALRDLGSAASGPARASRPPKPHVVPLAERFSSEEQRLVVTKYESGVSATALARELGVATSALTNYLRTQAVVVRPTKRLSDEATRLLRAEYEAGATMRELEVKHGLSHGVVFRAVSTGG